MQHAPTPKPYQAQLWYYLIGGLALLAINLIACDEDFLTEEGFDLLIQDQPEAIWDVWGTSEKDVFVVGSDRGQGPLILHWDGTDWTSLPAPTPGDIRTVRAANGQSDVWLGGDSGRVFRYARDTHTLTPVAGIPAALTVYALYAAPERAEVWAIAGDPQNSQIYHLDGGRFVPDPHFATEDGQGLQLRALWGPSSQELWAVGKGGAILKRSLSSWRPIDTPNSLDLHAVHGNGSITFAVGGQAIASVLNLHGQQAEDQSPPQAKELYGLWVEPNGVAHAAGKGGTLLTRSGSVWKTPPGLPQRLEDYRAVYVDPTGAIWLAGGVFSVPPARDGLLVRHGKGTIPLP